MICEVLFDKQALLLPKLHNNKQGSRNFHPWPTSSLTFMIVETSSSSVGYYRRARLFGISTGLATTVSSLRTVMGSLLYVSLQYQAAGYRKFESLKSA